MLRSTILAVLTSLTFAAPAFAQNAFGHINVAPLFAVEKASLHDAMKAMSRALKSIEPADKSKNVANAGHADEFVAASKLARKFFPQDISKLPTADQATAKAHYLKMIDGVIQLGTDLGKAFRSGNNARALEIMTQLNADKKEGHGEFK